MATFYVSSTGNAGNSGATNALPKPMSFLNSLSAGDVGIIVNGTHAQQVVINGLRGTASSRITIKGETAGSVFIDGGWDAVNPPCLSTGIVEIGEYDALFSVTDCHYVNFEDIDVIGSVGEATEWMRCQNLEITNVNTDISYGGAAIIRGGNNFSDPADRVNFTDCFFNKPTQAIKWFRTTQCGQLVEFIQSCFFFGFYATNCTATNCTVADGGAESLVAGRSSDNITFYKCTSYNGHHNCGYLATTRNSSFRYCLFYNTDAHVALTGGDHGVIFRDEAGALSKGATSSQNNTVEHCIFVNTADGITWGANATMVGHKIQNCTFVNVARPLIVRATTSGYPAPTGNTFENNLFYNNAVAGSNTVSLSSGITYRNNLLFGSTMPTNGQGSGDIYGQDPLLSNPDGAYAAPLVDTRFMLTAGSPAIGAGYDNGTTVDYFLSTYNNTPDIGAHQYDSTYVPPTPPPDPDPGITCTGSLLTNSDFSAGTTDWTAATDGTFTVTGGEAHFTGTSAFTPRLQLYQFNVPLTAGQVYNVTFKARSPNPVALTMQTMLHTTPFTVTGLNYSVTLTDTMDEYSTTFTATQTDANYRVRFLITEGEFYLDDICVSDQAAGTITADFVVVEDNVELGNIITIQDRSVATNGITGIQVDWGDGNVETITDVDKLYDHLYAATGTYTIQLTVTGPDGNNTTSHTATVIPAAPITTGDVMATFTQDKTMALLGELITFTDTSTTVFVAWEWDFGDDTASRDQNPTHAYAAAGFYNVIMTGFTATGSYESITHIICVKPLTLGPNLVNDLVEVDTADVNNLKLKLIPPAPNPGFVLTTNGTKYVWDSPLS